VSRLKLDIGYGRIQLTLELLHTIVNAMQIGGKANDLPCRGRRLLNARLAQAAEPQLLSMEGRSGGQWAAAPNGDHPKLGLPLATRGIEL
jgi:hypothetical protein